MINEYTMQRVAIGAIAVLLCACSTTETPLADGSAVRSLVELQTFDADATVRNGVRTPARTDQDRAAAAIKAMREGVAVPKETWTTAITTGGALISGE